MTDRRWRSCAVKRLKNLAFSKPRTVDKRLSSVVYVELHCENEECAIENLREIAAQMETLAKNGGYLCLPEQSPIVTASTFSDTPFRKVLIC